MLEKIKSTVKDYSEKYNEYTKEFEKRKKYIDANYTRDGGRWAEQYKAIKTMYDNQVLNAKKSGIETVSKIFEEVRSKLRSKITEGVKPEIIAELELLRTTKVTEEDIKAYLDKYYSSYLICKVLKEIAEDNNVNVEVLSIKDLIDILNDLEPQVKNFFDIYNGPLESYAAELILNGALIDRVDDQLKSFAIRYSIEELR